MFQNNQSKFCNLIWKQCLVVSCKDFCVQTVFIVTKQWFVGVNFGWLIVSCWNCFGCIHDKVSNKQLFYIDTLSFAYRLLNINGILQYRKQIVIFQVRVIKIWNCVIRLVFGAWIWKCLCNDLRTVSHNVCFEFFYVSVKVVCFNHAYRIWKCWKENRFVLNLATIFGVTAVFVHTFCRHKFCQSKKFRVNIKIWLQVLVIKFGRNWSFDIDVENRNINKNLRLRFSCIYVFTTGDKFWNTTIHPVNSLPIQNLWTFYNFDIKLFSDFDIFGNRDDSVRNSIPRWLYPFKRQSDVKCVDIFGWSIDHHLEIAFNLIFVLNKSDLFWINCFGVKVTSQVHNTHTYTSYTNKSTKTNCKYF